MASSPRPSLEGFGPLARTVDNGQYMNGIAAETIRNDERGAGDDKFTGTLDPSSSPCFGMPAKHRDGTLDAFNQAQGRCRVVSCRVFVSTIQVGDC